MLSSFCMAFFTTGPCAKFNGRLQAAFRDTGKMNRLSKLVLWIAAFLVVFSLRPALAQDSVPETSGFSGYFLAAPAYFKVESNLIATGAPLLDDVGNDVIQSIFAAPESRSSPALLIGGELDYTFANTRTQVFFGNRLEDLLRLDLVVGLGVRQELPDKSILAASVLATPLDLKVWSDPFVEGQARSRTGLDLPGMRLRWGRIMSTGLELTATYREFRFDTETSGDWLIGQGRLNPTDQPLLNRDGTSRRLQALYRIDVAQKHRFEPAIRYVVDDLDGAAVANKGFGLQLTYLYRIPKLILDANVLYGRREADALHPVYGQVLESDRYGIAVSAFIPVKRFKSSVLNLVIGAEAFREDANIAFYDSSIESVSVGILWRHIKK